MRGATHPPLPFGLTLCHGHVQGSGDLTRPAGRTFDAHVRVMTNDVAGNTVLRQKGLGQGGEARAQDLHRSKDQLVAFKFNLHVKKLRGTCFEKNAFE